MTMTTPEDNKQLVRRLNRMWQGDVAIVDKLFARDFVNHDPVLPDAPPGPEGVKQVVGMMKQAFPDVSFEIQQLVAEDDKVVFRTVGRGTHEGTFMGVEPTGRAVELSGFVMFRIEDGRIVERWGTFDTVGLLDQLGALPTAGTGSESQA